MKSLVRPLSHLFVCLCLLALPVTASAAPASTTPEKAAPVQDKPIKVSERNTPVAVELEGTDSIGARLATRVKESFNTSSLFQLSEKDTPKIRVLIATKPEFESRPGVGSAYAIVWLFSQSESTLRHFLLREVGVITPDEVNDLAAKIVERTDGLAVRYGYLFQ